MLKPFLIIVFRYLTRPIVNIGAIIVSWFLQESGRSRLIVRAGLDIKALLSFFFARVAVFAFSLVILAIYLVLALASCC